MAGQNIDRDKLRAAIRKMGTEYVFLMLDDAIALLPQGKLRKLIAHYLDPDEFRPDGARKVDLLADVKAFQKASLAGKYYQAFAVNSKNYREKSGAPLAWIADCLRLLERCLVQSKKEDPKTVSQGFEIIFSLLSKIDEGNDDILFFADEGGSWGGRVARLVQGPVCDGRSVRVRSEDYYTSQTSPPVWADEDARSGAQDRDAGATTGSAGTRVRRGDSR
jgi:hypothetical protein